MLDWTIMLTVVALGGQPQADAAGKKWEAAFLEVGAYETLSACRLAAAQMKQAVAYAKPANKVEVTCEKTVLRR